ncbi:hypothetical protein NUW58_g2408 [Xylaria curta]|uniref:Uncharacterized protein n=1 Tax=Xylaria curta TaxID=42375 RepID=A0ACC1PGN6_9PEZI|nr:hypothetical protein NUW58_g2408 [Xylaria curta]
MAFGLLPPKFVLASLAVSVGGLLNGYDTGSIGAITSMPQFAESLGKFSPSLLGFTVSVILLTGSVPSVFAGHLADKYGRLTIIIPGAVLFGVGALVQGTSFSQAQLIAGRSIGGFGEGIFLSIMSTYICEIAPFRHRGTLAGLPQFMSVTGISLGYFTCYGSVYIESSVAWRLPFIIQTVLSVFFICCCFVLPESPRWLQIKGRGAEAVRALERLGINTIEVERTITATGQNPSLSPWGSFLLLFRKAYRQRTILALFILGMVQLSGIDAILYYAPILFKQAGLSSENASFLASGVSGILMLAISVPGFLLADKWGRRSSAITGGVVLSGCMFLIGSLYAAGAVRPDSLARWVVIVSVFAFGLTYCVTWGIVGKIYASEIQPDHTRAAATCVAQGLGFFTNWLVAILAPILLDASSFAAYFLFGSLSLGTVAVLATYMPETRGRTLEDIQEAFHKPALGAVILGLGQVLGIHKRQAEVEVTEMESHNATGLETGNSLTTRSTVRPLSYTEAQAWKDIFLIHKGENENGKDVTFHPPSINGAPNLITEPSPVRHATVRRALSSAFSEKSLKAQEPLLQKYADLMVTRGRQMGTVNMTKLLNWATFDIMAAFTFGESLGLLEKGASSDWVAAVFNLLFVPSLLTGTIYYLLKNPEKLSILTKEIRERFKSNEEITFEALTRLEFLNACLREGLRIFPPIPSAAPREIAVGGNIVMGKRLPVGTRVLVHQTATYRSVANFKNPDEFIPERWLGDPAYSGDVREAHQPFSVGTRNCLVAWHEMRLLLSKLLYNFNLQSDMDTSWTDQNVFLLWDRKPLPVRLISVNAPA